MSGDEPASDGEPMRAESPARTAPATRYRYVDFAARAQPGFRNHLVALEEVPALVERWGAEECYASIFRFSADILAYLAEHRVAGRPSVAGYDGPVWAPFLPLDIDAHPPVSPFADALEIARRAHSLLVDRWHVQPGAVHVYFSGAKGFHILIDTRAAGHVVPAHNLHRVFVRVRLAVLEQLPAAARPLFDLVIGDKVRLLRLPNTRHAGSGLFKVALTAEELHGCRPDEIRALARTPRPLTRVSSAGLERLGEIAAAPVLVERFDRARRALRRERGAHPYRFGIPPGLAEDALCGARRAMWRGDVLPGTRNNVAIRLASAFRLASYTRSQSLDLLREWAERQTQPLPADEIERIVHSAYARQYAYTYGCHDEVIRSFCPYAGHLDDCADYHTRHPRSERNV